MDSGWYAFTLGYVLYGSSCAANNYFAIWLKSENFSVSDRNIIPTGTSLISAFCVILVRLIFPRTCNFTSVDRVLRPSGDS